MVSSLAVSKPVEYRDMYIGDMKPELVDLILATRDTEEVPNLENMIFDFDMRMVLRSIEEKRSIRSIIKEEELDYSKYIGKMRKYQTVGTAFMYLSPRSILGDAVGVGKTIEVCALINLLKQKNEIKRFLMAVENTAVEQTLAEVMRFTGLYVVHVPSEATKMQRMIKKTDWYKVDGIIIKHSTLRSDTLSKWLALNINEQGDCRIFDTFILDESSVIKNKKTKTYIYTKNMCKLARRVHFLNATTFETHIADIYNQIDMMNETLMPNISKFEKEYCTFKIGTYWTKVGGVAKMNYKRELSGYKQQEKFKKKLRAVYFGRSKKEVGIDIPHVHKVMYVTPTTEQSLALAKGYRYMEVLNCPSLIDSINIPTSIKTVPKIERLVSLIENEFSGSKVMVYCFHREAQEVIANELRKIGRNPSILSGLTKEEDRWSIQRSFNSNEPGGCDVIITNAKKSLNLYGGDACIFYSAPTNPSTVTQIAGRVDRNVDKSIKTFVLLLYKGTDEYNFFLDVVRQRAKDSRDLTIDAKGTVDMFMDSMVEVETGNG